LPYCLPEHFSIPIVENQGFASVQRDACRVFFKHYHIDPPIAPILQPEFANPLYLRLLCQTVHSRGLHRIPAGWYGLGPVIREFLSEKEKQFSSDHETSRGTAIVTGSLTAIARAIVDSCGSGITWSAAQRAVLEARPQAHTLPVLEWLVRADLLVEDAPIVEGGALSEEKWKAAPFALTRSRQKTYAADLGFENQCISDAPAPSLWRAQGGPS
jgi:hypothetical protein